MCNTSIYINKISIILQLFLFLKIDTYIKKSLLGPQVSGIQGGNFTHQGAGHKEQLSVLCTVHRGCANPLLLVFLWLVAQDIPSWDRGRIQNHTGGCVRGWLGAANLVYPHPL